MPLGVVSIFTFLGFLLGCIATDMARNNADDIYDLQHKHTSTKTTECQYGDVLFGAKIHGISSKIYPPLPAFSYSIKFFFLLLPFFINFKRN